MAPDITHDAAAGRYTAWVDGVPAGVLEYRQRPGQRAFVHTGVEPDFEGRGIGGALVEAALAEARAEGLAVLPYCPFVHAYLLKHPDDIALVPADRRAAFGLPVG
jgi:predicted GNAT family acetyltransferase